jgi:riboflavin synthase
MFTGIITATSQIINGKPTEDGLELIINIPSSWKDIEIGESISINGICLTVVSIKDDSFDFQLIPETLAKTTFGRHIPKTVNLERALNASGRLGGHFVQGHIDTVGTVVDVDKLSGHIIKIAYPKEFKPLLIPKGSIVIDGVALTVVDNQDNIFSTALIPHTVIHTTLGHLSSNQSVNLEFDMLGKYVINFMELKENAAS